MALWWRVAAVPEPSRPAWTAPTRRPSSRARTSRTGWRPTAAACTGPTPTARSWRPAWTAPTRTPSPPARTTPFPISPKSVALGLARFAGHGDIGTWRLRVIRKRVLVVVIEVLQAGLSRIMGIMSEPQPNPVGQGHVHSHAYASRHRLF